MQQLFNNYSTSTHPSNDNNAEDLAVFSRMCQDYDPHKEFLLLVSVSVSPDKSHQAQPPAKYILQYMKMSLLDKRPVNSATIRDSVKLPPTLILTAMDAEASKQRRAGVLEMESRPAISTAEHRELFLANIVSRTGWEGVWSAVLIVQWCRLGVQLRGEGHQPARQLPADLLGPVPVCGGGREVRAGVPVPARPDQEQPVHVPDNAALGAGRFRLVLRVR